MPKHIIARFPRGSSLIKAIQQDSPCAPAGAAGSRRMRSFAVNIDTDASKFASARMRKPAPVSCGALFARAAGLAGIPIMTQRPRLAACLHSQP